MNIEELNEVKDWEVFKEKASEGSELIILKYSPICGTSLYAENLFHKWADELDDKKDLKLSKLNVIAARQLSRQIAAELSVAHESPQIIWLRTDLSVKWTANHYEIDENKLNENLLYSG